VQNSAQAQFLVVVHVQFLIVVLDSMCTHVLALTPPPKGQTLDTGGTHVGSGPLHLQKDAHKLRCTQASPRMHESYGAHKPTQECTKAMVHTSLPKDARKLWCTKAYPRMHESYGAQRPTQECTKAMVHKGLPKNARKLWCTQAYQECTNAMVQISLTKNA